MRINFQCCYEHPNIHFNTVDLADFTSTTTADEDDEGTDFFSDEEKENLVDL